MKPEDKLKNIKDPEEAETLSPPDSTVSSQENIERGNWGNKAEFVLSCIGYAVGLGNFWRFPYICMRNGGGAFLIPYFTFMGLCGIPMFLLEVSLGQFASLSALQIWKICPMFEGIGWAMTIISAIFCIYNNNVMAWSLYYLGSSFTKILPWSTCDNDWNTEQCSEKRMQALSSLNETSNSSYIVTNNTDKLVSPAEEFWQHKLLGLSDGVHNLEGMRWELVGCLVASTIIVYCCLCKGVKSVGKVVWVTATVPYLFLTILLIRGLLLPGAFDGIMYFLTPDWKRLLEFRVWGEASLQIFISLGPAWGSIITMASYNKFNNNLLREVFIVPLVNSGTSLYAGFVIFSVIGSLAQEMNVPVSEVITSGPGLAFIAYPEALTKLPISPFWSVIFFLMVLTLGLDSQFCTVETIASGICDKFPKQLMNKRMTVAAIVTVAMMILGLPIATKGGLYVFQLMDWYSSVFVIMINAVLECVILHWIYGWRRVYYDIELMLGRKISIVWSYLWRFITPTIIMIILINNCIQMAPPSYGAYTYPSWALAIGWCIAFVSVVPIPVMALVSILRAKGTLSQRMRSVLRPAADWGPALEKYRIQYKYLQSKESLLSDDSKV